MLLCGNPAHTIPFHAGFSHKGREKGKSPGFCFLWKNSYILPTRRQGRLLVSDTGKVKTPDPADPAYWRRGSR